MSCHWQHQVPLRRQPLPRVERPDSTGCWPAPAAVPEPRMQATHCWYNSENLVQRLLAALWQALQAASETQD